MSILDFILLLIVAAICGSIGQTLVGYSLGGCLVSSVVGFLGAFVGAWLGRQLGLPEVLALNIGGQSFPVLWSVIGSALLVGALAFLRRTTFFTY